MGPENLRPLALFEGLTDAELAELAAVGEEVSCEPGDELFRAGTPAEFWWVLLEGRVELLRHVGNEDTVLATMEAPGQWAGFRGWDERGAYLATGRVTSPTRMLRVPAAQLGELAEKWFPFGVHLIKGLTGTVRRVESTVRQREALIALGTLAAGLAHEINNPASAATRAVDALEESCETLLSSLSRLASQGISSSQLAELDAMRREIEPAGPDSAPLAVADREDALSDWLESRRVTRDWVVAPVFAAAGVDVAWCERVAAVVGTDCLDTALHWVASSLATTALLAEVKESTGRVSSLVAAVRSYSQLDRGSVQRMEVAEGLESTLVMLAHKLTGVTVVRDYGTDVPAIEGIAGELNQVWTNLIANAADAMGGSGTLRVSTRSSGDRVVVEIADTGEGMPPEVQARVFEPFFTTKDVGQGTGLGLDISRRIVVERHGGDISIDQRPDETVFRVELPLLPATRAS